VCSCVCKLSLPPPPPSGICAPLLLLLLNFPGSLSLLRVPSSSRVMESNVGGKPASFLRSSVIKRNWLTMRRTFVFDCSQLPDCPPLVTFKEEFVSHLQKTLYLDASKWSTTVTVLDSFETSPMWSDWVSAGHKRASLTNFIHNSKRSKMMMSFICSCRNKK
jgi:hypothetical protein